MKIMVTLLSAIIIIAGLFPILGENSPFPLVGNAYYIALAIVGLVVIIMGIQNKLLMAFEKFFLVLQGIIVLGLALLPFFPALFSTLPRTGVLYAGIIIIVGAIGLLYGLKGAA
ncbi:hypothetical protein GOV09_02790 [Candidatus Woesearchaeota archaeon]|nr:hypothetical protein [Candidatus Woesearchaeota archaeon]